MALPPNIVEKGQMDLRNECNLAGLADTSAIRGVIGHLKIHFSVSSLVAWYNLSPGEFKHAPEGYSAEKKKKQDKSAKWVFRGAHSKSTTS